MFSFRRFIVSGLTFRSLIHFEFIFVYGVRECSNFTLLQAALQFSQNHLLKKLPFFSCIVLLLCHRLTGCRCVDLFIGFLSCSIDLYLSLCVCQYHTGFQILFVYFRRHCVFVAAHGLLQLPLARLTSSCSVQTSYCIGFSCGIQALGVWAWAIMLCRLSSCNSWALESCLRSWGTQAQLSHSVWDLPGPEIEPMPPALAGRFFTAELPRKTYHTVLVTVVL